MRTMKGGRENEVSHLCHENRCFNPEHMVVETHKSNMERQQKEKSLTHDANRDEQHAPRAGELLYRFQNKKLKRSPICLKLPMII